MRLPTTLSGIIGFILFIVIILGMTAPDLYHDESINIQKSQEAFLNNLNSTQNGTIQQQGFWLSAFGLAGLDGVYLFITNAFSTMISFIILQVQYLFFFLGIMTILPSEFYLFFAIISSSLIIAIIKLIFLSGE